MENENNLVTACITMGRRHQILRETLTSLLPLLSAMPVLAVNDFGDDETNAVFRELCPDECILETQSRHGLHSVCDRMYERVGTPFILHLEDDWRFDHCDFVMPSLRLLQNNHEISVVCVRDIDDFSFSSETYNAIPIYDAEHLGSRFARLDSLHRQWHGYTFNPHIARRDDWVRLGGFSQFRKERHISRALRTKGKFVAYLRPGACRHIGGGQSVTTPHLSPAQKFKAWLREL